MPVGSLARLSIPIYSVSEASRLASVPENTCHRWLKGYTYRDRRGNRAFRPPVSTTLRPVAGASFHDLVELAAIGAFRRRGYSLSLVRKVVNYCREQLGIERPLVSLQFKVDGEHIFIHEASYLLEVGRIPGTRAWSEILEPFLDTLEYIDGVAATWWPLGKSRPIKIDPAYGFGLPVLDGYGIRTDVLAELHFAGEDEATIARSYGLPKELVREAISFELQRHKCSL